MRMPPSGVEGLMDENAVIEAQIQLELENINLDEDLDDDGHENEDDPELEQDDEVIELPAEFDDYIKRLQDQTNKFEQELLECDELLQHTSRSTGGEKLALIPYEEQNLLAQIAKEHGMDPDEYRRKILEDMENDDDIIEENLADLIDGDDPVDQPIVHNGKVEESNGRIGVEEDAIPNGTELPGPDGRLAIKIEKAVEERLDEPGDCPVSQDLVPLDGQRANHLELQKMLRSQLQSLENKYTERIEHIKKDEAFRRNEEDVRQKRVTEERDYKLQQIQREEQQLEVQRQMAAREIEKEEERQNKELELTKRKFMEEMMTLERETEQQKEEYMVAMETEKQRQTDRRNKAVLLIQRTYRGYRVRKEVGPGLQVKRECRRQVREAERIRQLEVEIETRKQEQQQKEEAEKKHVEEEARLAAERKREKEEEKRRKKEEEERLKQEEKKRKEEEKQRKKEEERLRKEEEKRRKEEEKRQKEEEKRQKEEEDKRRREEEKLRKEEEKKRKEEEKQRKEEEKRQKEEEKGKEKERIELEKKMKLDESNNKIEDSTLIKENSKPNTMDETPDKKPKLHESTTFDNSTLSKSETGNEKQNISDNNDQEGTVDRTSIQKQENETKKEETAEAEVPKIPSRPKTPRSAKTPRTPRVTTPRSANKQTLNKSVQEKSVEETKPLITDSLPEPLEVLRLRFMRECQPWSKVSNEPWKLKGGLSRKPLRRPSSAKKLPPLPDDVILQAARVTSLKQVTTVELQDLPGNTTATLGQCWGLKYLTLTHCNLVALDGLSQCKQLLYVNAQHNRLEYVDLKDLGNIQYVNLGHNRLSSVHGLDNCTNLRWLDVSHNNITRLGGMDTLRRLHTLIACHNQLISTEGLGSTPTLQMLDLSHNHLQHVEDIDKLCLLLTLNVASNNLLQVPELSNQVLLTELSLPDNSLSHVNGLAAVWLPLLSILHLQQNSLDALPNLQNCLLLKDLDLSNNQLLDTDQVHNCLKGCPHLETLHLDDNPVVTDITESFYSKLKESCPCFTRGASNPAMTSAVIKPRSSFEAMCLSQSRAWREAITQFRNHSSNSSIIADASQTCNKYFKYCDQTFNMAVEHRYAHEYGEIPVAMPTAPTAPKSSRPLSSRQREKFTNPKEMFENALKASTTSTNNETDIKGNTSGAHRTINTTNNDSSPKGLFENALNSASAKSSSRSIVNGNSGASNTVYASTSHSSAASGKDLFEQALSQAAHSGGRKPTLVNGNKSGDQRTRAAIVIQAAWRGYHVRHQIAEHSRYWLAATTIQAWWRGYYTRKMLMDGGGAGFGRERSNPFLGLEPQLLDKLNRSAVKIQACWKGFILRKKLMAALEYAQCTFSDEDEDDDVMNMGDEFDLDKFVDIDQDLLDMDWKPPETPDIPDNFPVLKKPPSGRQPNNRVPPLAVGDLRPPSNPRRAWRNAESPLSDIGKIPRPPSSVASTELNTVRSGASKREEKLTEEWGFKDSHTAQLMMQRAKKMKYNVERRKKISKLDPKQKLALFRKLEEVTHPVTHTVPQRKTLPRKEYFQARQDEINRQEFEKHQEIKTRASRTFEWLHTQVGDHPVTDSVINKGYTSGPKYIPAENNLPGLMGGKRVQLVSSPMSMELQSLDSASAVGHTNARRFSAGSGKAGSDISKLPPIQSTSAPMPHVKERMSFRNPKVNESVGWGGGRKRAK